MLNRFNPFSRPREAGLDLGSHSIRWAVATPDGRGVESVSSMRILGQRNSMQDPVPEEFFRDRVVALLRELPPGVRNLRAALQGSGTAYGYLEFPHLSDSELEIAAQAEAQQWVPFAPADFRLSCTRVPPLQRDGSAVFYAAARKDEIRKLRELLAMAGCSASRIEVPPIALAREFEHNHRPPEDQIFALVHVGFSLTHLVLVRNGFPYFARDFRPAARDLLYALQMGEGIPWEQAERQLADSDSFSLEPPLERLTTAVRRSLDSFGEGVPVRAVYLSGGGACQALRTRLECELGIPVQLEEWERLWCEGEPGLFAIAVGLAVER
ncbi:MAG: pilus assembly protein PilM [Armatimonadetes bacterium]|nr:pilus assembly protein PilM [Armatimonadota bacterium]